MNFHQREEIDKLSISALFKVRDALALLAAFKLEDGVMMRHVMGMIKNKVNEEDCNAH